MTELEIKTTSEINNNVESRELRKRFYDDKFDSIELNSKLNKIADKKWVSIDSIFNYLEKLCRNATVLGFKKDTYTISNLTKELGRLKK